MGNGTSKKGGVATVAPAPAPAPTGPTNKHEALAAMQAAGLRSEHGGLESLMDVMGDENAVEFANTILDLEDRFGVSAETKLRYGKTGPTATEDAHVAVDVYNPSVQVLRVNPHFYRESNRANKEKTDQAAHNNGYFMPKAAGVSAIQYTAAHEFGHAVHNMLAQRDMNAGSYKSRNQLVAGYKTEIMGRAKKLGAKKSDMSHYGASNSREFFAEAFANAYSGAPGAIGQAMQGWLRDKGFAKA